MHAEFTKEILKERNTVDGLVTDGRIIRKLILKKCNEKLWIGFIWLRTENSDSCVNTIMKVQRP